MRVRGVLTPPQAKCQEKYATSMLSSFVVQADKKSANDYARQVFKRLKENLADRYEVQAYGRPNVRLCNEVLRILHRWIELESVETGFIDNKTDSYIVVYFKRAEGFSAAYKISKYKANWMVQSRAERKEHFENNNAIEIKR